jgi:aminoglycoside phosphotransferase (APT) family kinase protein
VTRQLLHGICAEYQAMFGAQAAESQLFSAVAQSVDRCDGLAVPLCWQHTDFVPWNMFREHGELRVIDWEVARPGPAVADLLHFLIHWDADRYAHRHEEPQVRRILGYLTGESEFPAGIDGRRLVDAYLRRMGVDRSLLPYLLVYTLAEQAVERGRRLRAAHGDGVVDADSLPFVAYLRAMAAQSDRLFPSEARRAA